MTDADAIEVRGSNEADGDLAVHAAALISAAASEHDIALRDEEFLRQKIVTGRAALALKEDELVGFGYWSEWESGRFISHSGLVVRSDCRGVGMGKRVKLAMFKSSRELFPEACLMSLTSSPAVKALNYSLGFRVVPLDELTTDLAFWKGCETCRNYADIQSRGEKCCCEGMLLRPSADRNKPGKQADD